MGNCLTFPLATFLCGWYVTSLQQTWDSTCLAPNIRTTHFQQRKPLKSKSSRKLIVIWKVRTEIETGGDSLVRTILGEVNLGSFCLKTFKQMHFQLYESQ